MAMGGGVGLLALLIFYLSNPEAFSPFFNREPDAAMQTDTQSPGANTPPGARSRGLLGVVRDLLDRSPGTRIGGVAIKGKTRVVMAAPVGARGPGSRVSAPATGFPAAGGAVLATPTAAPASAGRTPAIVLPDFPALASAPMTPGVGSGATGATGGGTTPPPPTTGGGGGFVFFPGIGGGGPPIVIIPPSPPVAPIPEPTAWIMMVLGFGVLGGAMRSRGRSGLAC